MKNLLLATSAIVAVGFGGAASAQSVLERVLGQIDNATNLAPVNGTFANIAENIGGAGTATIYVDGSGNVLSADEYAALDAQPFQGDYTVVTTGDFVNTATGEILTPAQHAALSAEDRANYVEATAAQFYAGPDGIIGATAFGNLAATDPVAGFGAETIVVAGLAGVDGSISNTVDGVLRQTQEALAGAGVSSTEWNMPTLNFGNMATTALGAVNTGTITLGVNSAIDEAATSTTSAISATMDQIGGSADTGALVLNIASNMTGVNGSITNVMAEVNGSIGNLSTTALGAVNTGDIVSGVDSAVQGIVGVSGANVAAAGTPAAAEEADG